MSSVFDDYCGVRAIVFDLDGTLIDTMRYFGEVASEVINKYYGISKSKARDMYFETSGVPFFQQLEIMFPGDSRNKDAAEEYERNKLKFFFSEPFSEELKSVLREVKLRYPGFLFAVSSNNFENLVREYMERHGVEVFDEVLGFRENFAKGRDHFNYLMNRYGLSKDEIVFIGDSWWDAEMALSNGVRFLGITTTFSKEEWMDRYPEQVVIEGFEELFEFLEVLSKCRQ